MFQLNQNTESTITYFNDFSLQKEEFPISIIFKRPEDTIPSLKIDPKKAMRKSNSTRFMKENKSKQVSFNFDESKPKIDRQIILPASNAYELHI